MSGNDWPCARCGKHGHTPAQHCDSCGRLVLSERQLAKYDRLGVDWVLCTGCER